MFEITTKFEQNHLVWIYICNEYKIQYKKINSIYCYRCQGIVSISLINLLILLR